VRRRGAADAARAVNAGRAILARQSWPLIAAGDMGGQGGAGVPYWRLSGYYFFHFAFIGGFSPYFGLYLQSRGFSAWHIAVLLSQMALMRVLAPLLWGWIADHTGKRVGIVRLAGGVSLLGLGGFFLADSFVSWLVAMAVLSFFWSAALPLIETLTLGHLAHAPARYSRIRLWGSVGFIVAVLAIGWLLDRMPIGGLLWILLALLVGILLCALVIPEAGGDRAAPVAGSLRAVLAQSRVRALLLGCFCMSMAHGALYVFYSIFLAEHGYSRSVIGALWSVGVVAEIVVFLYMARILACWDGRRILLICLLAAALRFLLIGWGVDAWPVLLFAQLLHGLTFGAFHAAAIAAVNHWFPASCRGRGQALYSSFSFGAGGLVGGLLSGAVWQLWGGGWTFTLSALCALLGALLLWWLGAWQAGESLAEAVPER